MLEILAPAGNAECAKAAIHNGADAVYLGYRAFSARQSAENFEDEGLREIIKYAHLCGVKVYVAMNTIVKDEETEPFLRALLSVWALGADAIILQDLLLGKAVHEKYPEIILHLSTQAGICNENGAKFARDCGFARVILARETPLEEMAKISKIIETEAFVQGALCTCYSGQCYFSSFVGGNSGNRGRCKQPCRKLYAYDRNGNTEKNYALSLSDLCVGEDIRKYIEAGVVSFKIEGRMRRAEYVAAAVRYYRLLLDKGENIGFAKDKERALSDLKRTYNRGNYTKGLAFGQDKRFLSTAVQGHIGEKVGVVKVQNGKYFVESVFRPRIGDAFKILRDGKELGGATYVKTDGKGFILFSKVRLKNGDGVFVTTDNAVNERVLKDKKLNKIRITLRFRENQRAYAECEGISLYSETELQTAQSRPLTEQEVKDCFQKTDGLPVEVEFAEVDIQGNIFIPKSALNAFRRNFYEKLSECRRALYAYKELESYAVNGINSKTAIMATDFEGVCADIAIYKPQDYSAPLPKSFTQGQFEKYLYYPPFATAQDELAISAKLSETHIDGIYTENYGGIAFAEKYAVKAFVGTGLNLSNGIALRELLKLSCVSYYAVSKELSEREQKNLAGANAFTLTSGDIKIMDLCYCPFGKTCSVCDKKERYLLTDENGRIFPVRRYKGGDGKCRFEVYNCAQLIGTGVKGAGQLLDLTLCENKFTAIQAKDDTAKQKELYKNYTSGHGVRGVL